ncbi:MAG: DUF1572 family protein [Ferruginibacter sp.]
MTGTLTAIYNRDLNKLKAEIEQYRDEKNLWRTEKNIANAAGNLCLHLVGNLNHFIGAILGNTGYTRNRELEFSQKDISKEELILLIEGTIKVINDTLAGLNKDNLDADYPVIVFEKKMTTEYFLIHLLAHLSYHLGQINYHRRLLDQ